VEAGVRSASTTKWIISSALALMFGLIGAGTGLLTRRPPEPPAAGRVNATSEHGRLVASTVGDPRDTAVVRGRVVGPDGQPLSGARVFLATGSAPRVRTTSKADGSFQFHVVRSELEEAQRIHPGRSLMVAAMADGCGLDWKPVEQSGSDAELSLQLVRDPAPITGRVIDSGGQPLAGVTVRVIRVETTPAEHLISRLQAWQSLRHGERQRIAAGSAEPAPKQLLEPGLSGLPAVLTTDQSGWFRLAGIGQPRLVALRIEGPAIEHREVWVVSQSGVDVQVLAQGQSLPRRLLCPLPALYGPVFDHVAEPSSPIVGVVREKETGAPLAGVLVMGWVPTRWSMARTVTDAEGRFRLLGLANVPGRLVKADANHHQHVVQTVGARDGSEPLRVEFELARGHAEQPKDSESEPFDALTNPLRLAPWRQ
jgi:protocatechuate 3,4-dioxygenase beta subunit